MKVGRADMSEPTPINQFGNWSRDDASKLTQDFLTKHPEVDAVRANVRSGVAPTHDK